jgi:MraZ protein
VLIGEFQNNMDPKKRLVMPIKFRNILNEKAILTRGFENCIFVFSYDEWNKMQSKLEKLSLTKKSNRLLTRFFLSSATPIDFDSQGRINIPKSLCEHANLTRECNIIGMGSRLEIWNSDNWKQYIADNSEDLDEIIDEIEGVDL